MDLKTLYKPVLYFDDAQLEVQLRRKGFVKKKAEGLRDQFGMTQASDNVYYMYQLKGKILTFYTDIPRKDGKLIGVLFIPLVTDIIEEIKGRPGHIELKSASGLMVNLKIDNKKEREEWLKGFRYFKNYYKNDNSFDGEAYLSYVAPEMELLIQAESELSDWDINAFKTDYSSFIRDKGLVVIIENNIIELIKNRIAITVVTEEIKDKKGSIVSDLGTENRGSISLTHRKTLLGPMSTTNIFHIVLISQRPINIVDEEFNIEDDAILNKDSLPSWMDFNTIYYFSYSGSGDTTQFIRSFNVS